MVWNLAALSLQVGKEYATVLAQHLLDEVAGGSAEQREQASSLDNKPIHNSSFLW